MSAAVVDRLDETNKKVLMVLDGADDVSSEAMIGLLQRVLGRWQRTLAETGGFYREPPGTDGRHVSLGAQLEKERGKSLSTEKARAYIKKLAELLELDEEQAEIVLWYFLRHHYLQMTRTKEKTFRFGPEEDLTELFAFYNLERVSALKAASSVFRMGMDASHKHQKIAAAAMNKLVEADIFGRALSLYHKLANASLPDKLTEPQMTMWVHRNVEEQVSCLELLFLAVYSQEGSFSPSRFLELLNVFEQQSFGVHQLNRSHLNGETRDAVVNIGTLSLLVLLTSLNLESLLQDERAVEFFSELLLDSPNQADNIATLLQINDRMLTWGRIRHHGPVLLAWAVFHCRIEQLAKNGTTAAAARLQRDKGVQDYLAAVPYQTIAATAFNLQVMKFLTQCATGLSLGSEHNLVGYLSILKQLLSATLTAFDINVMPNTDDFVAFACRLFSGQPALCSQFWAWDANHAARGSLLQLAQSRYPLDTVSWLKLLRSLACEPNAAVHVLNAVQSLKTFTQALPAPPACGMADCRRPARVELAAAHGGDSWLACDEHAGGMADAARGALRGASNIVTNAVHSARDCISPHPDRADHVVAQRSIFFPDDTIRIASGTVGVLVWRSDTVQVVCWHGVATGWLYLVRQLELFLKPRNAAAPAQESVDRVSAILALISRLLAMNGKIGSALPQYIKQQAGNEAFAPNLLSILFQLVEVAPLLPPLLTVRKLATRALRCIASLAQAFPAQVWTQFSRRSLLEPTRPYGDGGVAAASGGAIRRLLQREELPQGRYTVTLSFLDLLQAVLSHILQWSLPSQQAQHQQSINPQEFLRCLKYVRADVLSSYYSWKYVRVSERWRMGIQILTILRQVLTDVRPTRDVVTSSLPGDDNVSLQQSVMRSLAGDSSFHHVLLSVAGIGHEVLLRKSDLGQFADRQTLEQLVVCGLTLLEQMLESSASLVEALLNKTVRTGRNETTYLVLLIAQYVHYPHANSIPLLAVRVLARLCNISTSSAKGPPPILGYLGDAAGDIRRSLLELLANSSDAEVRIAILRLIGAAVDHQPGLAETLLTTPEDSSGSGGRKSAVQIIMDMLSRRNLYDNHPRLLSEALALLHSLWSRAPNHTSILHSIRKETKDFWTTITQCLDLDRPETQDRWADIFHKNLAAFFEAQNDSSGQVERSKPDQQQDIVRYCYNVLMHSIVLRILALECFNASESLDDELKELLSKMRDSMQVRWFNEYTRFFFPAMKRRMELAMEKIGVDPVMLTTSFRSTRSYGDAYVYDLVLLKQKFSLQLNSPVLENVCVLVGEANNQLSVADAQIVLLESWKTLLQVGVAKIPGRLIDASRGPEMGVKLIHGFQNKVDSRLRVLEQLDPHENSYLLEVVLADLLDIGQHFTRVYLEPLLLGDQKLISYLVRIYCQLFRFEVVSLDRLQQGAQDRLSQQAKLRPSKNDGSQPVILNATIEEMLRVKRAILTTILSVLLLFVHHQPEVFERCVKDTEPGQEADVRAVWKVVFTEVLSLVPSVFQTCVMFDATAIAGEDSRMLTSISLAMVSAILRNMKSAAGTEYLLYADLGRSGFLNRLMVAMSSLLDRPELAKGETMADEKRSAQRGHVLAMLELVLQVCLGMAGQAETAAVLGASDMMTVLCDSHKTFFRTLRDEVDVPLFSFSDGPASVGGPATMAIGRAELIGYLRVWCLMTSTVMRMLDNTAAFLPGAVRFAAAHRDRMTRVLTCVLQPPFVLTLATAQEARRICQLLYSLSCHMAAWKLHDVGTAITLENAVLSFLTQCAFLLSRAETLAQHCRPGRSLDGPIMSDDHKNGAAAASLASAERRSGRHVRNSSFRASMVGGMDLIANYKSAGADPLTGMSFTERIQCELYETLRTCLALCRHDSPTLWKFRCASEEDAPLKMVPIFGSNLVRPVSMNDPPSLGTLDLVLAALTLQLEQVFGKAGPSLREVDVLSVSRIESSAGLMMMEASVSDTPARNALVVTQSPPQESKTQKRRQTFVRACHMLLSSVEETLFLILSHCQYYNSMRAPVRLSDELAASVLRQIHKVERLIESRAAGEDGREERAFLEEKRVFLAFCAASLN